MFPLTHEDEVLKQLEYLRDNDPTTQYLLSHINRAADNLGNYFMEAVALLIISVVTIAAALLIYEVLGLVSNNHSKGGE